MIIEEAGEGEGEGERLPQVRFDHWRFRITRPPGWRARSAPSGCARPWSPGTGAGRRSGCRRRCEVAARVRRGVGGEGADPRPAQTLGQLRPDGTLRFNWRVVMLPPALLEYIVVHELAHLTVKNHSPDFWNLVDQALPDAQARRRRLRETGPHLPF